MEAFKRLGVQQRVQLQFCSDIDVDCRTWLREMRGAQFNDQCNIYEDLKQRKFNRNTQPHIYTVVIPSYSWSSAGKGKGESDNQRREDLFPSILAFIQEAQPYVFILEDVKGLLDWPYRARFKSMIRRLKGHGRYYVY